MLVVSLADFTTNVATYIKTAETDDVSIEKDGKPFLKLVSDASQKKLDLLDSLVGIIPADVDVEKLKKERTTRQ